MQSGCYPHNLIRMCSLSDVLVFLSPFRLNGRTLVWHCLSLSLCVLCFFVLGYFFCGRSLQHDVLCENWSFVGNNFFFLFLKFSQRFLTLYFLLICSQLRHKNSMQMRKVKLLVEFYLGRGFSRFWYENKKSKLFAQQLNIIIQHHHT